MNASNASPDHLDSMDEIRAEDSISSPEQVESTPRPFGDLSLLEVVGMMAAHPLATLVALRDMLRQENAYHAVAGGPSLAARSLLMVDRRPGQEIDWQRYLPTLYMGGLL